jgi:HK97 gp10 family phage protein
MKFKEDSRNKAVYLKIKSIEHDVQRGIRQGYYRLGKQLVKYTSKKMLEKPKSGRTYYIYKGNRTRKHVASAPWEYPAQMTAGTGLRSTLDFKVHGSKQLEFGAKKVYAKYLELGTKRMKPRKFLRDAIKDNIGNAQMYFDQEIKKYMHRGKK